VVAAAEERGVRLAPTKPRPNPSGGAFSVSSDMRATAAPGTKQANQGNVVKRAAVAETAAIASKLAKPSSHTARESSRDKDQGECSVLLLERASVGPKRPTTWPIAQRA
jgi:hypothetical protein